MNRLYTSAAALVLALGFAGGAMAATNSQSATLPLVNDSNAQAIFAESTVPVGVLVTSDNCAGCAAAESILAQAAARHPEMKFVKTAGDVTAPGFLVIVPGIGPSFSLDNFAPTAATIDGFIAKRADVAQHEQADAGKLAELKLEMEAKAAPFNTKLAEIQAQAQKVLAPYNAKLATLQAQSDAAAKPYTDEGAQLTARMEAAQKPFTDQIARLQPQLEAILAPFNEKAKPIGVAAQAAMKDLLPQIMQAQASGDKAAIEALKVKGAALVKPYYDQLQAIQKDAEAAGKPLSDRIAALQKQADDATAVLKVQIDTAKINASTATLAIDQDITDTKLAGQYAVASLTEQAKPIQKDEQEALAPLMQQVQQIAAELQSMVQADQAQ